MEINAAWDIIERVLRERSPEVAATLRGPVSDDALERLARTARHPLPADLVASLRRHDGQENPTRLLDIYDHYTLLSAEAMMEASEQRAWGLGDDDGSAQIYEWMTPHKVRTVMNCRGWLQFTDAEGNGYAVDLDPLPAGQAGQVIYLPIDGPTPEPEFDSYTAWLSHYAQKLDAGEFTVSEMDGLWLDA